MNLRISLLLTGLFLALGFYSFGQTPVHINGVFPKLTVISDDVTAKRTETGIGALMAWANKLWMVGYVAHIEGNGIGLYEISEEMTMRKHPESVTGTYANRMVHQPSNQAVIGPHIISVHGNVRTFKDLARHRLTATFSHLTKPDSLVYFLTMEGLLFEANVHTLQSKQVADLVTEFYGKSYETLKKQGIYIHFKGGYCANNRVIVANNSYQNEDYMGKLKGGRLAEWNGKKWTVLDSTAYVEVNGKPNDIYGNGIWATGWDRASVKLMFYSPAAGQWRTYRLPKGSQAWEHAWNTEWMRIREAQTERFLMDVFGIFYELPVMAYGGNMLSIKPVCNHLRVIPDFISWRGMFVMAGDQIDNAVGQPQSNLLFANIDDLWRMGKPSGSGAVWRDTPVKAGAVSDPFLMNGFDKKTLHLRHDSDKAVTFTIEVDLFGDGRWAAYQQMTVPAKGYRFHVFPDGYSAQWVRVTVSQAATVSAQFVYN
jgi:hypothetical protein